MTALTQTAAPENEPVTTAEAKLHLRVDHSTDDDLIDILITAARRLVERESLHALITQTWCLYLPAWPAGTEIELPWPPLQSVTHIKYTDEDGDVNTLSTDVYAVDTDSIPGRVYLKPDQSWPSDTLYPGNPIAITFDAGFGDESTDLPAETIAAEKLLVAAMYENRGDEQFSIPAVVSALLADLRAQAVRF